MQQQILGISIGSQGSVIGTLKRSVEVILSDTANREVPTAVSYNDKDRAFGDAAMSTIKSNFQRTVVYPNRWIGIQRDWPFIEEEAKYANVPPVFDKYNKIGFKINYKGQEDIYTAESLMGLFFAKLKKNWHREGYDTKEVVVSVPDYCTAHERKAMLEALQIADLQCISLINESSAIALAYGLLRKKEFDDKPRLVGFVDMGQSKTTIFFGTFTHKVMKVVSVSSERFCGAREFDYLLAEHMAKDFEKKYGCNPMKSQKCKIRLIDAIAKVRKILTVNKEGTVNVDCLMDGEDLVYNLTKVEFEKIIQPVVQKFSALCKASLQRAIDEAKISLNDLHSIEMVGDAVRTPIIQEKIKEVLGKDVSKTLLPDECISRGCTLYNTMNSPFFQIKDFEFEQYNPYSIVLEYPTLKNGEIVKKSVKILNRGDDIPKDKSIKFTEKHLPRSELIPINFYYSKNELEWMPNLLLKGYNVSMPKTLEEHWTFALTFTLDSNCLPNLTKTTIDEVYYEEVPVKEPPKLKEEPKTDAKAEGKKDDNKEQEKPKEQEQPKENKKPKEPPKMEKVKRERSTLCSINQVDILYGTSAAILEQMLQKEVTQETDDKVFHIASHKKNELEQFIYNTREKFNNVLIPFVTNEEKAILSKHMDELLTWLYSDDPDLFNKAVLDNKSKDMMYLGNIIYSRFKNWSLLDEYTVLIAKAIEKEKVAMKAEKEKGFNKETTYCNNDDYAAIEKTIELMANYLKETKDKMAAGIKTAEPPMKPEEVEKVMNDFSQQIKQIYSSAEFRVKEAERLKKEEEDRIKREAEEKKKKEEKEEEEKKKKEEEEKKAKEGEPKKDEDVIMKDETQKDKKEDNKMDVDVE